MGVEVSIKRVGGDRRPAQNAAVGRSQKIRPKLRAGRSPDETWWMLSFRSAPPLALALLGQWHEEQLLFRWRWRAWLAAQGRRLTAEKGWLTSSTIERYVPGSNVMRLPLPPPATLKGGRLARSPAAIFQSDPRSPSE